MTNGGIYMIARIIRMAILFSLIAGVIGVNGVIGIGTETETVKVVGFVPCAVAYYKVDLQIIGDGNIMTTNYTFGYFEFSNVPKDQKATLTVKKNIITESVCVSKEITTTPNFLGLNIFSTHYEIFTGRI